MDDKELLERAARAAGLPVEFDNPVNGWWPCGRDDEGDVVEWWNPLEDDGDALRLAVRMRIPLGFHGALPTTTQRVSARSRWAIHIEDFSTDRSGCAATRRAIVRAAMAGEE